MFKQIFLILFALAINSSSLFAQNACLETYDRDAIYLRSEFWRGKVFIKNGTANGLGFAYNKLKPEFDATPHVIPLFKKAQRNNMISVAVGIVGLAGATLGAIMALHSVDDQGNLIIEQRYNRGVNLIIGSTVISAAITLPLQIKSHRQLDDAIWLRNREMLGR